MDAVIGLLFRNNYRARESAWGAALGKKKDEFEKALLSLLSGAEEAGRTQLTITAGALHRAVGGYAPQVEGEHHAMATASNVLTNAVKAIGGKIIYQPPKGRGSKLEVELPIPKWIEGGRLVSTPKVPGNERNPTWASDELILALDLYFRRPPTKISKNHPDVIALSELLNRLPIHTDRPDLQRFRNANGVYMKMCNFLRFDPSYEGTGLTGGGRGEEVVWKEFSSNRPHLEQVADAIRRSATIEDFPNGLTEDGYEAPEGTILSRLHRVRERSRTLVNKKKRHILSTTGKLACEVCDFNYAFTYGELGEDFIECHHTKPLSTLTSGETTNIADLAVVCANCHRMLHRKRPWHTLETLRSVLTATKESSIRATHGRKVPCTLT